jgi:peroxin-5
MSVHANQRGTTTTAVPGPGIGAEARSREWAEEYSGVKQSAGAAWADEFQTFGPPAASPANAWAEEFRQEQETLAERAAAPLTDAQAETASQSARLAATLASDPEGKFANSKFLNFMSRMSRGEIVAEGNGVAETGRVGDGATGSAWANEFSAGVAMGQFGVPSQGAARANASHSEGAHRWADEFSDAMGGDWASEFQEMRDRGEPGDWSHDTVWNQIVNAQPETTSASERSRYEFIDPNPYLGRPDCLRLGRDLFRRGVLSEAALALEAAVRADGDSCEGWRLLSTVHAENDDDRRAIAAATKAHEADPKDLEALLSLGVSHTNELDHEEAVGYMREWLRNQPLFRDLEARHTAEFSGPGSNPQSANSPANTLILFKRAAERDPQNADVRVVLGVLAHLCRSYDEAIEAFHAALDANPSDYSLWNKLGATRANSARSHEAMAAYQRALDLKPNYVRAWANMGIGYANQGKYEQSLGYYVRALSLNPRAESVWGYLRVSLGCCGRVELMDAVDSKDLTRLRDEFPL